MNSDFKIQFAQRYFLKIYRVR